MSKILKLQNMAAVEQTLMALSLASWACGSTTTTNTTDAA